MKETSTVEDLILAEDSVNRGWVKCDLALIRELLTKVVLDYGYDTGEILERLDKIERAYDELYAKHEEHCLRDVLFTVGDK